MNCNLRIALLCLLGSLISVNLVAQNNQPEEDKVQADSSTFSVYPILFYFPETDLGFGGGALLNYYPGKIKSTRPSQWQFGAAYTLNEQILLFASYQYFLKQNQIELFGELGYYDYFYFYYGLGNETSIDDEESYFVRFPRLRINALQQVVPQLRVGLSYKFDDYRITSIADQGLLDTEQPTGYDGGIVSALGVIARYDTRDNINLPRKGSFMSLSLEHNPNWLGSPFNFSKYILDLSQYYPLGEKSVLALNIYTGLLSGDAPFQELHLFGGPRRARGIIEGRYRDRAIGLVQGAYRFPLIWRLRGAVFSSLGRVGSNFGELLEPQLYLNYGLGLRFLLVPNEGIQFRFDVGLGGDALRYYLTIGEAF